jgi:Galactose oxidase, central domain
MSSGGATGSVVLFGGGHYTQNFGDTWVWNGSNWQQRSPSTSPPARSGLSMVFDDSISKVVLFGGYQLDDMWTWDGNNWTQLVPASTPPDRYSYGMDYDGAAHAVVLFGGFSSGPIRGDTWKLSVAP